MRDVPDEIAALNSMPFGPARTAAAEAVTRRIEAEGPVEHLAWALSSLVEAYTFSDEGEKAFVTFARMLRLWDESPELFDEADEHSLFWEFKWIADGLAEYPQITTAQAEAFLDDMERRFVIKGRGVSAVGLSRFGWLWHTGDPRAEEARLNWVTTPRDEFDDCEACTIGRQVDYFVEQGRWGEAVSLGLTQRFSCNIEPAKTRHAVALAALMSGDPVLAGQQYRLGVATLDTSTRDLAPARGQGFAALALGGELERALRVLRNDDVRLLDRAPTPLDRMRFLLGVLTGLSANLDLGELPTGLRSAGRETVAGLHAWTREAVAELAERFDRRNGNHCYSSLVAEALSARRVSQPIVLPSATETPPPEDPSAATAAVSALPEVIADTADAAPTAAAHFDAAERSASLGDLATAEHRYRSAAQAAEDEGLLELAGICHAEAAQCAASVHDEQRAHESFSAATPLLEAGGAADSVVVAVLTAWAPIATRMNAAAGLLGALTDLLDRLEPPPSGAHFEQLSEELAERRRAEHARLLATARHARPNARGDAERGVAGGAGGIESRRGGHDRSRGVRGAWADQRRRPRLLARGAGAARRRRHGRGDLLARIGLRGVRDRR